jgi:hypothetical protein
MSRYSSNPFLILRVAVTMRKIARMSILRSTDQWASDVRFAAVWTSSPEAARKSTRAVPM